MHRSHLSLVLFSLVTLTAAMARSEVNVIENCTAKLSYRLQHHPTFVALMKIGLPKKTANALELQIYKFNELEVVVPFIQSLNEALRAINNFSPEIEDEREIIELASLYITDDLSLLSSELQGLFAHRKEDRSIANDKITRSLLHLKTLNEFFKVPYEIDQRVVDLLGGLGLRQGAINPSNSSDVTIDAKIDFIYEMLEEADPRLLPFYDRLSKNFDDRMVDADPDYFESTLDTMYKILMVYQSIYDVRALIEDEETPIENLESTRMLARWCEMFTAGPAVQYMMKVMLDQFLHKHSINFMRARAMLLDLEPIDEEFLRNLVLELEKLADSAMI